MTQSVLQPEYGYRRQTQKKHFVLPLWFPMAVVLGLVLLRDLVGVGVPRTLFTVILGISFMFVKEDMDIALFVSLIGVQTRLNINEISLVFFLVFLLRRFRKLKFPVVILPSIIVLFLELLANLFSSGDLMNFFRFAVMVVCSLLIATTAIPREHVADILSSYVVGASVALFDVLVLTFRTCTLDGFFARGYRLGQLKSFMDVSAGNATTFNPNMLAAFVGIAVYLTFLLWYVRRIPLWIALPLEAFLVFAGLLTQSRSLLLCLVIFYLFLFFANMRTVKSFLGGFLALAAFGVLAFFLLSGPLYGIYERYVYRFTIDDVSNGRGIIWTSLLDSWMEDPRALFIGYGIRSYSKLTGGSSAHNAFFEVLGSWGVLGFFLVALYHIRTVIYQKKLTSLFDSSRRIPLVYYSALVPFISSLFGTHLYTITVYTILFALAQISIRLCDFDDERLLKKKVRRKTVGKGLSKSTAPNLPFEKDMT